MAFGQPQGKDRAGIAGARAPAVVNLHIQNLCVLLFDASDYITNVVQRFKLHIDVQKRGMPLVVALDSAGGDLYVEGPAAYLAALGEK